MLVMGTCQAMIHEKSRDAENNVSLKTWHHYHVQSGKEIDSKSEVGFAKLYQQDKFNLLLTRSAEDLKRSSNLHACKNVVSPSRARHTLRKYLALTVYWNK